MERKRMRSADAETRIAMGFAAAVDTEAELRDALASVELPPQQKFRPGQSVLQWWASWMVTAKETPDQLKKSNRPKWYSSEVISHEGFQEIRYAGSVVKFHTYRIS